MWKYTDFHTKNCKFTKIIVINSKYAKRATCSELLQLTHFCSIKIVACGPLVVFDPPPSSLCGMKRQISILPLQWVAVRCVHRQAEPNWTEFKWSEHRVTTCGRLMRMLSIWTHLSAVNSHLQGLRYAHEHVNAFVIVHTDSVCAFGFAYFLLLPFCSVIGCTRQPSWKSEASFYPSLSACWRLISSHQLPCGSRCF